MRKSFSVASAACLAVAFMGLATTANAQTRVKLQTLDGERLNRCLEANDPAARTIGGNSFMNDCANVTGQAWIVNTFSPGVYQLQSSANPNLCLEGNNPTSPVMNGGAFMAPCARVTGQLWREVTQPGGRFQLTLDADRRLCLEGNTVAPGAAAGGAALLQPCANTTGQSWRLTVIP